MRASAPAKMDSESPGAAKKTARRAPREHAVGNHSKQAPLAEPGWPLPVPATTTSAGGKLSSLFDIRNNGRFAEI